jgi:hypothetical protein
MRDEKIIDLLNGDRDEFKLGLEMMRECSLGETFDIMKMLDKDVSVDIGGGRMIDGRNWFVFRLFNLPTGSRDEDFRWSSWDISTIRWICKNRDLMPDRVTPFFVYGEKGAWVIQNQIENYIVEYRK